MSNIEYDIYAPIVDQNASKFFDANQTVMRVRALTRVNPYMAGNPQALMSLAMSNVPTDQLLDHGAAMYGMQAASTMQAQLEGMSEPQQRAVFNQLSPAQRQTLEQSGYKVPKRDEDAWYESITNPIGTMVGGALNAVGTVVEHTPVGDVLDGLQWLGDQVIARPYRAIRTMDDSSQWAALIGAVVAAGAVIAAPVTGGLSLGALAAGVGTMATIGTVATGAAIGGTIAAAATNPTDWYNAWTDAEDGERTFDRAAQRHADSLLGDPRLLNVARDMAFTMPQGYTINELVRDVVGQRDVSINSQIKALEDVAKRFADPTTAEYQKIYSGLVTLIQQPVFQEAVTVLQNGKISVGRDVADNLLLTPGSTFHSIVSGAVDGTLLFAADPTMLASQAAKYYAYSRRGISAFIDGEEAVDRFYTIVQNNEKVAALHDKVAEAITRNDYQYLKRWAPGMTGLWNDLTAEKNLLMRQGDLVDGVFTREHLHSFITQRMRMKPLMEGIGTAHGLSFGTTLSQIGVRNKAWQIGIASPIRAFTAGLTEPRMEKKLLELIDETPEAASVLPELLFPRKLDVAARRTLENLNTAIRNVHNQVSLLDEDARLALQETADAQGVSTIEELFNPLYPQWNDTFHRLSGQAALSVDEITPELLTEFALRSDEYAWTRLAHRAGRRVGGNIVGSTLGSFLKKITTMIPEGKAISLTGQEGPEQIKRFTELGSLLGMPAWMRDEYARALINQPTVGMRMTAMQSFLDTLMTVGGIRTTEEGQMFADAFLDRIHHAYAAGGLDTLKIFGRTSRQAIYLSEMADAIVMPSLTDMRRAMQGNYIAKLVGLTDAPLVEAVQSKIWKPSVLLRFGFIPRAAGEEMLNFMVRGNTGGLVQELGARSHGRLLEYNRIVEKIRRSQGKAILTDIEAQILSQGPLSSSTRLVQRMMARGRFETPVNYVLERFDKHYQEFLEKGFGYESRANRYMSRLAGTRWELSPGEIATKELNKQVAAITGGTNKMAQARLSNGMVVDSILFGSPFSWRRMALGGVHDELIEAGQLWYERNGTAIMREVGASVMGPYDPARTNNDVIKFRIDEDALGKPEYAYFQVIKGQRELKAAGDGFFINALHHEAVRPVEDEILRSVLPRHVTLLPPERIRNYGDVPADIAELGNLFPIQDAAVQIAREYSGEASYDHVLAALNRSFTDLTASNFGRNIAANLSPQEFDLDTLLTAMRTELNSWTNHKNFDDLREIYDELEQYGEALTYWKSVWKDTNDLEMSRWWGALASQNSPDELRRLTIPGYFHESFRSSWEEMASAAKEDLVRELMRPENQRLLGNVQGLNLGGDIWPEDFAREFEQLPLHQGMVTAWMPAPLYDPLHHPQQFEDLQQHMLGPILDDPNYETEARKWFDEWSNYGTQVYMSDKALADDLANAVGKWSEPTFQDIHGKAIDIPRHAMAVDLPRGVITEFSFKPTHAGSGMPNYVISKTDKNVAQMWATDPGINLAVRHPDAQLGESVGDIADRMIERARQVWTRGNEEYLLPRVRMLEDGTPESLIYESTGKIAIRPDKQSLDLRQVPMDRKIVDNTQYFNSKGEAIAFGDERYFNRHFNNGNGDVLWEYVGPIVQDAADDVLGRGPYVMRPGENRLPKDFEGGVPSFDVTDSARVRVFRSKPEHVQDVTHGLLNFIDAEMFRPTKLGKWDSFVRAGFDKVIGPGIDALARRPMAFHFFAQRYMANKGMREWLMDPTLMSALNDVMFNMVPIGQADEARQLAGYSREVALLSGEGEAALRWSDTHSLSWLRGHSESEYRDLLEKASIRLEHQVSRGAVDSLVAEEQRRILKRLAGRTREDIQSALPLNMTSNDLLAVFRAHPSRVVVADLPPQRAFTNEILSDPDKLWTAIQIERTPKLKWLNSLTQSDAETISAVFRNWEHVTREAADAASIAAINDMMPFLDSHTFKTQFSEYGKGFLPFWYAEENFMKRWARTLNMLGPEAVRKAQLGYMGLKTAGVVRTDPGGRDWFVWPGSNLLQEAINKIPGMPDLPAGVLFETPTDMMLPGINSRFGTPQFGPLVSVPMDFAVMLMPEAESMERKILGDIGASRSGIEQLIPAPLLKTYSALTADDSDTRFASAQMTAIAQLEASGQGLKENATPGETDEFLRTVRNHARIILVSQAIGGWFAPGPLSTMDPGEDTDLLTFGVKDASEIFGSMYQNLVKNMGIEQGTLKYLEMAPLADLPEIVNPLAYTIGKSVSTSGAPLPATEIAQAFYDANSEYMDSMPNAGPWLLPNDPKINSAHSQYAYDQQTINGLRQRRTPAEFLDQMKFKEGASTYFANRVQYRDQVEAARARNDRNAVSELNQKWSAWSTSYKATHPKFAEMLESSDARQRRNTVISEMRTVIRDPESPIYQANVTHGSQLQLMMLAYDRYLTDKNTLSADKSIRGRLAVEQLKGDYESYMDNLARQMPILASFWLGVLRPESELD